MQLCCALHKSYLVSAQRANAVAWNPSSSRCDSQEAACPPLKYQTEKPLFWLKISAGHSLPICSCLRTHLKENKRERRRLGLLYTMSSSLRQGAVLANLTSHQLAALSDVPMLAPPPGVKPSLRDPEHNSKPFFIVTSILLFLMAILIINRAYAKTYIVRKYTWDDCKLESTKSRVQANAM